MCDAILYFSPIGNLYIAASASGLTSVKFKPDGEFEPSGDPHNPHILEAIRQLEEYFRGDRQVFDLSLDWSGATDFYRKVWIELLKIPYGETVAYSDIANALNNPKAIRAVGMANARNPLPIIVPCHRVIGKSGGLHGFAGGLEIKEQLLHIENPSKYVIQQELF